MRELLCGCGHSRDTHPDRGVCTAPVLRSYEKTADAYETEHGRPAYWRNPNRAEGQCSCPAWNPSFTAGLGPEALASWNRQVAEDDLWMAGRRHG